MTHKTSTALVLSLLLNAVLGCALLSSSSEARRTGRTESDDWDTFITALAWVESRWTDHAESSRQAVGYLQVTPILVRDANRIVGAQRFTLDCRTDRQQSILMFNIIQDNYNPQHDMHYALKLWNPYAKPSYHRAVMKKYDELKTSGLCNL